MKIDNKTRKFFLKNGTMSFLFEFLLFLTSFLVVSSLNSENPRRFERLLAISPWIPPQ